MSKGTVRIKIGAGVLVTFFTQSPAAYMTSKGLPPNADLVSLQYDEKEKMATAIFEHEDFPVSPEGFDVPEMNVEFTTFVPQRMKDVLYPQ